jgi:aminomethyltransferase
MVPFGGWDMPVSYPAGTLEEHRACRGDAVVFDVSHLGTVRVEGPGARDALQATLTNDLGRIAPGRAQYTHLLDDAGGVLDDIIVWWVGEQSFDVMPNASNTDRVVGALTAGAAGGGVEVADTTASRAVLAVQGPNARRKLAVAMPAAAEVGRFRVAGFDFGGAACLAAGTGYTGEDGVELAVPATVAEAAWAAVAEVGIQPAGLGARDTLRLEAGLPLHGHELGPGITPLNAGLGWVVAWDKGPFPGREALVARRDAGVDPVLRGLRVAGRRPPRSDQAVLCDGEVVGRVTSGNFSPTLGCGIAMALLSAGVAVGAEVGVDVRGTLLGATVVDMPFVAKHS